MRRREVSQDAAFLLLHCRDDRQYALDKMRAALALGAKAALTPLHTQTNRPFGRIVGRLYAFDPHKLHNTWRRVSISRHAPPVLAAPH